MGAGILVWSRGEGEVVPPHRALSSFPARIGEWTGKDRGMKADIREVLGDGDFLLGVYQRPTDETPVDLYIAYFPTQRAGSTMHSPQNCLPGAGWTPIEHNLTQLGKSAGKRMTVNRSTIAKGQARRMVRSWYQAQGRVVASEYWGELYLVTDPIQMNRTDGGFAYCILASRSSLNWTATCWKTSWGRPCTHLIRSPQGLVKWHTLDPSRCFWS